MAQKKSSSSTWLIVIGIIVLAVVAYFVFGPKDASSATAAPVDAQPAAASSPAPATS